MLLLYRKSWEWATSSRIGGALARSIRSRCSVMLIDYYFQPIWTESIETDPPSKPSAGKLIGSPSLICAIT